MEVSNDLERAPLEPPRSNEKFQVDLPGWSGPYDLILKVIDEQDLNLLDLDISKLLDHYMAHLQEMVTVDVEEAGEFLVVAATLAQIKSKMLLPKDEREEEEPEEDPRAELVRYLQEYQQYKEAAKHLQEQPLLGRDVYKRGKLEKFQGLEKEGRGHLFQLVKSFQKILREQEGQQPLIMTRESISVGDRMGELVAQFHEQEEWSFEEILGKGRGKDYLISSFLAVLELVRMKKVGILQSDPNKPIFLKRLDEAALGESLSSEFDETQAPEEEG